MTEFADALWNLLAIIGALSLVVSIPVSRWMRDLEEYGDYWHDQYRDLSDKVARDREWEDEMGKW